MSDAGPGLNVRHSSVFQYYIEACLLQAKIHYCKGLYQLAIDVYNKISLDDKTTKGSSSRLLCILAESHAIKGM
jgi:hypothetical protein